MYRDWLFPSPKLRGEAGIGPNYRLNNVMERTKYNSMTAKQNILCKVFAVTICL